MEELENLLSSERADLELPAHLRFEIVRYSNNIDKCSREQAINLAKLALKCLIIERHNTTQLLKHKWFEDNIAA
jgi:hypothetical protein